MEPNPIASNTATQSDGKSKSDGLAEIAASLPRIDLPRRSFSRGARELLMSEAPRLGHISRTIPHSCAVYDQARPDVPLIVKVQASELGINLDEVRAAATAVQLKSRFRTNGMPVSARTFGWKPRVPIRDDYCSASALAREQPQAHHALCAFAGEMSNVYKAINPKLHAAHDAQTQQVLPDYRMLGTPYTSGVLNRDYAIRYHFDRGNFPDIWSAMLVLKKGYTGGALACPELDTSFELRDGCLFFFDGQNLMHGVTTMNRVGNNGYRISIVYYSLYQMWKCLTLDEEIQRIRSKRTEREVKRRETGSKVTKRDSQKAVAGTVKKRGQF